MTNRRKFIASIGAVGTVAIAGCSGGGSESSSEEGETITHQIGDTFSVGEGEQVIEYTVNSAEIYEAVGSDYSPQEPDGIFLVVQMELTNQGDESFSITTNAYSTLDSNGNSFDPDTETSFYLDQDGRIEAEAISFDQLNPGLSTSGAVVFDVPAGEEMRLQIEPTGFLDSSNTHEVELRST